MGKIIIFDICGTLYHSNTTCDFCEWQENRFFLKKLLIFSKTIIGRIINKFFEKLFGYDWIRSLHIYSLKGKSIDHVNQQADIFVKTFLINKEISETHKILSSMNRKEVILVSATLKPVAQAIAKYLRVDLFYATTLLIKNGIFTGNIQKDLSGIKHNLFENKKIDFVATDNLNDSKLCLLSRKTVIISRKKHLDLWKKKNIKIDKLIIV